MNWDGGCDGGGYLSLKAVPNPAACSQYLPGTERSHTFRASGQAPFVLDATKPIAVDFTLDHIVSGAAEFEVTLEATIGNQTRVIASGAQAVTAETAWEPTAFHYDLEPDVNLHLAKISYPSVTITWSDGATWSNIDMESGNATVAFTGAKS
jgi:hypothetical protein